MAENKRVDFQAGGNLLQYMQQTREEAKRAAAESLANAQKQTNATKEQIALIKAQLELEQKRRNAARETVLGGDKAAIDELRKQIEFGRGTGNMSSAWVKQQQAKLDDMESAYHDLKKEMEDEDKEFIRALRDMSDSIEAGNDDQIKSNNDIFREILEEFQRQRVQDQEKHNEETQNNQQAKAATGGGGVGGALFKSLLGLENLRAIASDIRQAGRTEDGFDAVVSSSQAMGRIVGGAIGAILGTAVMPGAGTAGGAAFGAFIGGELAGGISEQMKRSYDSQMEFARKIAEYQGLTGSDAGRVGVGNRALGASLGLSMTDMVRINMEVAKRAGTNNLPIHAEMLTALEKALGINSETTMQLVDTQRMSIGQNKSITGTMTGLLRAGELRGLFKGGDRTFFNEFMGQFNTLAKQMGAVQTNIDDAKLANLLFGFNSLGGQWQLRDPRAMGNITNLNQSLANPGDDIAQAINMRILRRMMPSGTLDQLLEEQSKGVFSKSLLQGVLSEYGNAPEGTVLTALRNRLGGNMSYDALRELYNNRGSILDGTADINALLKKGGMSEKDILGTAQGYTVEADKFRANITNAYIDGAEEGIKTAIGKISDAIEAVFNRQQIKITVDKDGNVTANVIGGINQAAPVNKTFKPSAPQTIKKGERGWIYRESGL